MNILKFLTMFSAQLGETAGRHGMMPSHLFTKLLLRWHSSRDDQKYKIIVRGTDITPTADWPRRQASSRSRRA